MKVSKQAVLKVFQKVDEQYEFREIMRIFGVGKGDRPRLKEMVDDLVDEGTLQRHKGNRYSIAPQAAPLIGKLTSHRDGYGFVTPEGGGEDIFIPARYLRESMHGDRVEVRIAASGRSGKAEGRIVRTIERGFDRIVGTFHKSKNFGYVIPDEQRITRDIYIPPGATGNAEMGQIVVAKLTSYPSAGRSAEGRVLEVLGWPEDPGVEAETVIRKFGLPRIFPADVITEARSVSQEVDPGEIARRVDLRGRVIVTIDGETARDFDDAVGVQTEAEGAMRLWVSIADVSHYVHPAAPLDAEAFLRGTSVYFPDRCIPMLPEELSNGICSLNPHVDRLTVTVEMVFDEAGHRREMRFYPSVIRSAARLTYTGVKQMLEDEVAAPPDYQDLLPHLQLMKDLAVRLNGNRKQRGSIDFDLPEPEIVLDIQGQTEAIVKAERNIAHRIIEEFMLAANEAVASLFETREVPCLYRIHEEPDPAKVSDLVELIRGFGHDFKLEGERLDPLQFQKLLADVQGTPEERLINGVLLRALKQARYSDENLGHFGLAASCYTHFTSPIRRYPDLVVHRILKDLLAEKLSPKKMERLVAELPEVASHTSQRERVAMEAEREMVLLKKIQFMRDKVGQEFDGFITGVSQYGFYVELVDLFIEGMVHISTLPQDFYRYVEKNHLLRGERSKRTFRMGDKVRVLLAQVSTEKRQMDFVVSGDDSFSVNVSIISAEEEYARIPVRGKRPALSKARLYNLQKYDDAVKALRKVPLNSQPAGIADRYLLKASQALVKSRRYKEAEKELASLLQKSSSADITDEAALWQAKVLVKLGREDEAVTALLQLADASKNANLADRAIFEAALIRKGQKKGQESLVLLKKILTSHPSSPLKTNAAWEIAWGSYLSGDTETAAEYLKMLCADGSSREKALYWYGRSRSVVGDTVGAQQAFESLVNEYPFGYYAQSREAGLNVNSELALPTSAFCNLLPIPSGLERIKALITLGLWEEARKELAVAKKKATGKETLPGLARLYLEMDDYNGAYNLLRNERLKTLDSENLHLWGLCFPLGYQDHVARLATRYSVPQSLIYAVIKAESSFLPTARSPVGAIGLMQLMPTTAAAISKGGVGDFDTSTLTNPQTNIDYGVKHLRDLLVQYKGDQVLAVAAYNAGSGNVNRWQKNFGKMSRDEFIENIPFTETREYVKKVLSASQIYSHLYRLDIPAGLTTAPEKEEADSSNQVFSVNTGDVSSNPAIPSVN